jgi:hypothetical protein
VAAQNRSYEVAERLIALGADVNQKDYRNWTALDYVRDGGGHDPNGLGRLLVDHGGKGRETYVWGMPARRLAWDALVLTFSLGYVGTATYLQQKTYDGHTRENPFRWVSYGLLVTAGATAFTLSVASSSSHNDPYGAGGMGQGVATMISGAFTVGYGVLGLWLRNSPYGYYGSAGLVAALPLISLSF